MKKQQLLVLLISLNLGLGLIFSVAAAPTKTLTPAPAPLVTITAYSSTPEQTDDTPFITASGHPVEDGVVASNFLAFNTKIKLPELYGEKIFIVKDRMAKKNSHKIDIWFPTTKEAKKFGVKKTIIEIVES